ncbi:glycosyltransferase family 2 protein [Parvularcula oceani]|uniref:glycosyltransferase family 2 protein n=1 Tax=Parvularcula oceani TaxID=1247963 RepID=UPI000569C577|nr:glycosyltransferase family 2 protein [Parvularcula oceani]
MDKDERAAVTVVIVSYNAAAQLPRCLDALSVQTATGFDVIVVDNASIDGSVDIAADHPLAVTLIRSDKNLGFAAANNLAAKQARGEWIALLNPDAYPEPDWLDRLLAATERHPGVDAFGSTQVDAHDPSRLDGLGDGYFFAGLPYRAGFGRPLRGDPGEGEVFGPCAAAALWRKSRFLELGGFEERFFCYGEDVDLAFRHRLSGGRAVQVGSAKVRHEGSGISGRRSDFTTYHGHRNRVWTYLRDMPRGLLLASLPFHLAANLYLVPRLALAGQLQPYLRALRDAVRGMKPFLEERRELHREARGEKARIAHTLTWSPLALLARRPKIWSPKP